MAEVVYIAHPKGELGYRIINKQDYKPEVHGEILDPPGSPLTKEEFAEQQRQEAEQEQKSAEDDEPVNELDERIPYGPLSVDDLNKLPWDDLRTYARRYDVRGRSRDELISELLEVGGALRNDQADQ